MNTYQQLRKIAAKKRDDAIKAAKLEYNETIQKIAELETRLKIQRRPRPDARAGRLRLADHVYDAIPDDRTFTLNDLIGTLKASHPDRKWIKQSVNVAVNRFLKAGAIKRIAHAGHKRAAVFAFPHIDEQGAKTLADWAIEVLESHGEPLKPVEVLVRMTENGFELPSPPNEIVRSLKREMVKKQQIFVENDGFWMLRSNQVPE